MKLRSLIKRAFEIISEENRNVMAEFREDDGSITPENEKSALELQRRYTAWLNDAKRVLGVNTPKRKSARHRVKNSKAYKIVVQK